MEQNIGNKNNKGSICSTMFTEEEREVAKILIEMSQVNVVAGQRLPFTWGSKRKRSAIQVVPCAGGAVVGRRRRFSSSPPLHHGGAAVAPSCDDAVVKAEASSPATPLSLSLTESDEKPCPLRKKASLKRKREYYLNIIEDLTKSKALLSQEIDNVKGYCDQLKAFNLKLKARKQELIDGPKGKCKNPYSEIGCQMQLVNASVNSSNSMAENHHQKQQMQLQMPSTSRYVPLMLNQTSGPSQAYNNEGIAEFQHVSGQPTTSFPVASSSSSTLGMVKSNRGPLAIPDLNAPPEEFIPVDSPQQLDVTMANKNLSKAMAAQARQRRIEIYRHKNPFGNSKPRYSYR